MADLLERLRTALSDRHAVEREMGRGGMARVFLADCLFGLVNGAAYAAN